MWKSFFVNWDWRRLWMLSLTIFISAQLVLAIPCGLGLVRQDWSYFLLVAVRQLPKGWAQVLLVVLPTEIADIGREGVMIGLVTSFCTLISIAGRSFWETLSEAAGGSVSLESIREDSSATRNRVVISAVVFAVINLLGVSMVLFLPSQKLDAQQLRSFGGYNPKARNVVIGFFLGLVCYAFVANVTAI
ncbi:TPA: hypothetical protein N0F65_006773 [Lagenidium giganteum]|uniref:Uncharacterized protein n=1 Tax=Lagenidium giganteum TaxID=4803 RepID=A0AAV2ZC51_9STRA|nr:TPA: hypothetical protein N0F65_006773 [Lagenidium giganteum]